MGRAYNRDVLSVPAPTNRFGAAGAGAAGQ
jgi:hypothetical protein